MPEEWRSVIQYRRQWTKPSKKKSEKAKWLSEVALQIAEERREVKSKGERERGMKVTLLCPTLQPHGIPWNSPGQNTGVGSLALLQGIFPTQGSNPGLPHCRRIVLHAESQGKPKNTGVGCLSLLQRIFLIWSISPMGIEPRSPALQMDSLPTELSGKPKGKGSTQLNAKFHRTAMERQEGLLQWTVHKTRRKQQKSKD